MIDPVDEAASRSIDTFDGKKLVDLGKEGVEVLNDKEDEEEYNELKNFIKESIKDLTKVTVSKGLGDIACAVVSDKDGLTANMEKLIRAHASANKKEFNLNDAKRVMVINVENEIIKNLNLMVKEENNLEKVREIVKGLYNTALIQTGYTLNDPNSYALWVQSLIQKNVVSNDQNQKQEL